MITLWYRPTEVLLNLSEYYKVLYVFWIFIPCYFAIILVVMVLYMRSFLLEIDYMIIPNFFSDLLYQFSNYQLFLFIITIIYLTVSLMLFSQRLYFSNILLTSGLDSTNRIFSMKYSLRGC